MFIDENDTPEAIGEAIAQHFSWNGTEIITCMLAALTDANFHTLAAQVDALYKEDTK
jgi:hypothetical protein